MILSYAFCQVPVASLRAAAGHRAEQVSQVLYGEKLEVLEASGAWFFVRCTSDDYSGWCLQAQVKLINAKLFRRPCKAYTASDVGMLVTEFGQQWMPLGSELFGFSRGQADIPGGPGRFKGRKLSLEKLEFNEEQIRHWAFMYLHAPYLWGGKTTAGIDCSGLSQMVFRLCGVALPRDSKDQAETGTVVDFLQDSRCGDLAFFDNAEGNITHVGILLGPGDIIHASETSGRVALDRIDTGGIISVAQRKRTHKLRLIRRYEG